MNRPSDCGGDEGRILKRGADGDEAQDDGGTIDDAFEQLGRVLDELASLRATNEDLNRRIRRLEAGAGRGLPHPSEYTDMAVGPGA
ncbi:MAG: hypothetical protein BGO49_26270 [Planctomycetales bacterium 71-10]|nr:MAG: hypothetical protein BGO49_26270 [Planctomycetales bacterium 71-10]